MAEEQPEQFGRYELVSRIGQGGMAETWRAQLLGAAGVTKPVLIKKVLPEFANDEAFIEMFISEARISATLSHGNIAQVFDFGRMDGQYFLAMELVDGQPLHRVLKRAAKTGLKRMPIPLAVYIAQEMCRGLHYAHSRTDEKGEPLGIVHRDISPDNVLVSYEGQVKIVDFGIAKARMLRSFNTEPGIVRGKFLYFSPEQARGYEVDARTDVWATGLVLYEMLCGHPPVSGSEPVIMSRLAHGEFPSPREVRKDLPSELNEIVMRALSVDASLRYASANAFGDELASFLHGFAPRFSTSNLAYLLRELYREDLRQQGRELAVPPTFIEELTAWRGTQESVPLPPSKPPLSTLELDAWPTEPRPGHGSPGARPAPSSRSGPLALILGGGLVLLAALAIPSLTRIDESGVQPPDPTTLGPDSGGAPAWPDMGGSTKNPSPDTGAGPDTSLAGNAPETDSGPAYPERTVFRLDSRQHVLRVSSGLVAFSRLDEAGLYAFWATNPTDGLGTPSILEPSPRRALSIFFLLVGEEVPSHQREGVVARRPLPIHGVRAIYLFTLGEPVDDDLPSQTAYLRDSRDKSELRFTFHPEPMRVSASKGLLIRGLDVRQSYVVSLTSVGEGVFLRGRKHPAATQVACVQWSPVSTARKRAREAPPKPVQFFLSETSEVKVRGIHGLRCGFLDDSVSDNEGEAEVRIAPWDPKRPKPTPTSQDTPAGADAAWLFSEAHRASREGRVHDAFLLAEDCLAKVPDEPECLLLSGALQERLGRKRGSLERYHRFMVRYPHRPEVPMLIQRLAEEGLSQSGVFPPAPGTPQLKGFPEPKAP